MDPDAAWDEALTNAWKVAHGPVTADAAELCAEALLALDEWLRGGGFFPGKWETKRERVTDLLDVDTVAAEALAAARSVLDEDDDGAGAVLARRVLTLNAWLSSSGALPVAWTR